MKLSDGYRYGLTVTAMATAGSFIAAISIAFASTKVVVPNCFGRPYIVGDPRLANFIWTCPDPFRFSLISLLLCAMVLVCTAIGHMVTTKPHLVSSCALSAIKVSLAAFSVAALFILAVYASEYLGGMGRVPIGYTLGIPILVSLVHFPRWSGVAIAVPVAALSIAGLMAISLITAIPLD